MNFIKLYSSHGLEIDKEIERKQHRALRCDAVAIPPHCWKNSVSIGKGQHRITPGLHLPQSSSVLRP